MLTRRLERRSGKAAASSPRRRLAAYGPGTKPPSLHNANSGPYTVLHGVNRTKEQTMRTIAVEEHILIEPLRAAMQSAPGYRPPPYSAASSDDLADVGAGRLADLDAAGIDVQVLSWAVTSGFTLEQLEAARGTALARDCNDAMAEIVRAHPDRFAGFALLAWQDPEAAAAELERAVTSLGMKGVMVNGITNGHFLDHPGFQPVLAAAEALDVPIYLHPALPPPEVYQAYFGGLPAPIAGALSRGAWGWH